MALQPQLFHEIVDLLLPFMSTEDTRRMRLEVAFMGTHDIVSDSIDCSGSPLEATRRIVSALDKRFGEVPGGIHSIYALLDSIYDEVGVDKQKQIDEIQRLLKVANKNEESSSVATRHVFVSYSRRDNEFTNQLIGELQKLGISVWIDHVRLKPGTANWEQSIRDAIHDSYGVILIASPDARQSSYVQAELAVAKMYDKPIFPLWVRGDHWIDCVPMELVKTQYVDARNNSNSKYLEDLHRELVSLGNLGINSGLQNTKALDVSSPSNGQTISILQLIYTRVESEFSPRGRSGYQTVLYSEEMSSELLNTIEQRVGCFRAGTDTRHQFFVASGFAVLTHSCSIETDREVIDRSGRPGVFVAHCLAIRLGDFERIQNDPFSVFTSFPFIKSSGELKKLLESYLASRGIVPETTITTQNGEDIQLTTSMNSKELDTINTLTSRLLNQDTKMQPVTIVGDAYQVFATLRLMFIHMEMSNRLYSSFDTATDGCPAPPETFWAIGKKKRDFNNRGNVVVVNEGGVELIQNEVIPQDGNEEKTKLTSSQQQTQENLSSEQRSFNKKIPLGIALQNFLARLFPSRTHVLICPRCLTNFKSVSENVSVCPECQFKLSPRYVDELKISSLSSIRIVGWSQTGKTVYLNALTVMLLRLSQVWGDYSCTAANQITQEFMQNAERFLGEGTMPSATPLRGADQSDVYIMLLRGTQPWGNRILVAQDYAGESFNDILFRNEVIQPIIQESTVLMFVSLADLETEYWLNATMLLNNYVNTLTENGIDLRKNPRNVVVVLTKADLLSDLPNDLKQYVLDDPFWENIRDHNRAPMFDAQFMENYLTTMSKVSKRISEWLRLRDAQFSNLINFARHSDITIEFSIISSQGFDSGESDISEASAGIVLSPHRVLDPYFWALRFQSS